MMQDTKKIKIEVPVWEKLNLSIKEAAVYSNIGINKLEELLNTPGCTFVLYVGTGKRLIKRKPFEKYLENKISI